jgi:hypothetical protein
MDPNRRSGDIACIEKVHSREREYSSTPYLSEVREECIGRRVELQWL